MPIDECGLNKEAGRHEDQAKPWRRASGQEIENIADEKTEGRIKNTIKEGEREREMRARCWK